jgi:5'-phosphate synthase pdxT subunit
MVDPISLPVAFPSDSRMKVGVVSLQGDFERHALAIRSLGLEAVYVREPSQLALVDGLILPGGESTTMLRLLDWEKMFDPLVEFAKEKPLLGTCAGCILMAGEVSAPEQRSMSVMDISVERNAYGRQVHSSIRRLDPEPAFVERSEPGPLEAVFIRAPLIRRIGKDVQVLIADGSDPVLVEQGLHMAATFHPELSADRRVHKLFADKIRGRRPSS